MRAPTCTLFILLKNTSVLILVPDFYPTHSGAGYRFFRYLPILHKNDIDVSVITGTPKSTKLSKQDLNADWRDKNYGDLVDEYEMSGAKIFKFRLPEKNATRRKEILLERAIEHCKSHCKPDIVHIITPIPSSLVSRLSALRQLGCKLVYSYTIVDDFPDNFFLRFLYKIKLLRSLKRYDVIIVPSAAVREVVLEINADATVKVIPNGVDSEKYHPVDKAGQLVVRDELKLPATATLLISVGAIHPRKGTHLLVAAWSKLVREYADLHVLLIGPRIDQAKSELTSFSDSLEQAVDDSCMTENVHFLGQADNVEKYLQASDIFVFPSKREGMPNAVLEAMSSGLPVLLTPFAGLCDEMGREGEHYLLATRTADDLEAALRVLLENPVRRESLGHSARQWVVETMNIHTCVQAYARLYKSIA